MKREGYDVAVEACRTMFYRFERDGEVEKVSVGQWRLKTATLHPMEHDLPMPASQIG